jgi:hypothetical protein
MLNLALTTDKLALITSAAGTVDVHVSFVDDLADAMTAGKQNTATTTATTTDICAAPAGSTVRNVKFISIRNKDAALTNVVTVHFNANATLYQLIKCTLLIEEELVCREGVWFHYDSNGGVYGQALPVASDTVVGGIQIAVQSDLEAATSLTQAVTPGRQHFHPGMAKFVCFTTGTTTPAMQTPPSYNMTSITDAGVGRLTVTIATDFSSANWACLVSGVDISTTLTAIALSNDFHVRFATMASGSVEANCHDATATTNALADPSGFAVVGFGDQA